MNAAAIQDRLVFGLAAGEATLLAFADAVAAHLARGATTPQHRTAG